MNKFSKILSSAEDYINKNISCILTDEGKAPIPRWRDFQKRLPSLSEIQEQSRNLRAHGLAIICGEISGNLEAIDIDSKNDSDGNLQHDYLELVEKSCPGLWMRLRIHNTVSKGLHLLYRCDEIEGNQKLAQTRDKKILIESRGQGGYFVVPPTPGYSVFNDARIPTITGEERKILLNSAKAFNEAVELAQINNSGHGQNGTLTPWEDFNNRADVLYLLIEHGWTKVYEKGERVFFRRPGKDDGVSGDYHKGFRLFKSFSTSTKFEAEKGYKAAAVYAVLQHGGDFPKAASQLYMNGYGARIEEKSAGFSDEVYENLPAGLREICYMIECPHKRAVILIGCLTALSAAFSRYRFYHGAGNDVKMYSPHLLSLVIGAPASGKGMTRYGRELVSLISLQAKERHVQAMRTYKADKYDFDKKRKDSISIDTISAEPIKPPKTRFEISASDTTQAALVEILNDNPIGCFGYDSEVDTMVQASGRKDFGGFSDVIRKVFQHEPLPRQRKGELESYIVEAPRLAVMLSGTADQLKKLIPSESNGLFSRFWFYSIPNKFIAYEPMTTQTDIIQEMVNGLQHYVWSKADLWNDELIFLDFSKEQLLELASAFDDKQEMEEKLGGDIGASWIRMGLIVKRMAAILAALQGTSGGKIPDNCWCAAMAMLPAIKAHCIAALYIIRENCGRINISHDTYLTLKKSGMTDDKIAEELGVSRKTILRRKRNWENGTLWGVAAETQYQQGF